MPAGPSGGWAWAWPRGCLLLIASLTSYTATNICCCVFHGSVSLCLLVLSSSHDPTAVTRMWWKKMITLWLCVITNKQTSRKWVHSPFLFIT